MEDDTSGDRIGRTTNSGIRGALSVPVIIQTPLNTHRLLSLEGSSAISFPLPFVEVVVSRVRLDGDEEEETCCASSFSFCLALTLALDLKILTSAGAVGFDVDGCSMFEADGVLLDVASVCWVKSI